MYNVFLVQGDLDYICMVQLHQGKVVLGRHSYNSELHTRICSLLTLGIH